MKCLVISEFTFFCLKTPLCSTSHEFSSREVLSHSSFHMPFYGDIFMADASKIKAILKLH